MSTFVIVVVCIGMTLPSLLGGSARVLWLALAHPLAIVGVAFVWRAMRIAERLLDVQVARYRAERAFYEGYGRCAGGVPRSRREPPPWDYPFGMKTPPTPPSPGGGRATAPGVRTLRLEMRGAPCPERRPLQRRGRTRSMGVRRGELAIFSRGPSARSGRSSGDSTVFRDGSPTRLRGAAR